MAFSKTARSAVIATTLAALIGTTMTTSAEARWRGRHGGGLALGIGSLIVGGILASQYNRRDRYHYSDSYYAPTYGYYSSGPRYYGWRHHRHHRHHWR
jgi:hypothetical protein